MDRPIQGKEVDPFNVFYSLSWRTSEMQPFRKLQGARRHKGGMSLPLSRDSSPPGVRHNLVGFLEDVDISLRTWDISE